MRYNTGYDYIYQHTTSYKNGSISPELAIAKTIAMQFDKYRILSTTDLIINAFSSNDAVTGSSTLSWPSDYSSSLSWKKSRNNSSRN